MRGNATGRALTESWRESGTGRGRRGTEGTETGRGGTGKDGDHVVQTGTGNAKEVAAAAEKGGANAGRRKETEKIGAGRRTGITTRTGALRERGPETGRAEQRTTTGDTKTIETDTGKTGRPKGRVGAEAEKGGIRAAQRKRPGREIAATAKSGKESAPTNVAAAKRGVATSEIPAMSIVVNTVNGKEARALSKGSDAST